MKIQIMRKKVLSLIPYTLSLMMLIGIITSCNVHQWPEPNNEPEPDKPVVPDTPDTPDEPDDPNTPEEKTTGIIALNLQYITDFTYRDFTYDSKTGAVKKVSEQDGDTYDNVENIAPGTPMKVTVKIHRDNSARTLVAEESFIKELEENFDSSVEIEVPLGDNYLVTVWSHLLDEKGEAMYDDSDFNSIGLIKEKYKGNTDMRDAFRGRIKVAMPEEGDYNDVINMRRPMCKLEFVSTGLQEFFANEEKRISLSTRGVSAEDYTVVISYPGYYPSHYMAMEDRLEFASQGYSFSTPFTVSSDDDTETSLGFDYVMINDSSDAAVQAQVTVIHKDGTQVASTGMITIPMQRDRHVVLKGNFLTTNGGGGVGLDPDFEGDFNIPIY